MSPALAERKYFRTMAQVVVKCAHAGLLANLRRVAILATGLVQRRALPPRPP